METLAKVLLYLVVVTTVLISVGGGPVGADSGRGLRVTVDPIEAPVAQATPATCSSAALNVSPQSVGSPGSVGMTATGFAPGTVVTFEAGTTPPGGFFLGLPASVGVGSGCAVNFTITVPAGQVGGLYGVRAVGTRAGPPGGPLTLNGSFTVIAAATATSFVPTIAPTPTNPIGSPTCLTPSFSVSPSTVSPVSSAATVSFVAAGFSPGALVTLSATNLPPGVDFSGPPPMTASATCQVSGTITVQPCANCPTATYTLQARGLRYTAVTVPTETVLTAQLTVIGQNVTPTSVPPQQQSVTLNPSSGPPGTVVNASWTAPQGLACTQVVPNSPLQAFWDGATFLAQTQRGTACAPFTLAFTIPQTASVGAHTISFVEGTFVGSATFSVTGPTIPSGCSSPSVAVANNRLSVGQSTTVRGRGFAPGSRAELLIQGPGGSSTTLQMGPASSSCELSATITIQANDVPGAYTLIVLGTDGFGAPTTQSAFLDVTGPVAPVAQPSPIPTATSLPPTALPTAPVAEPTIVARQSLSIIGGAPVPMVGVESIYRHEITLQIDIAGRDAPRFESAMLLPNGAPNGALVRMAMLGGGSSAVIMQVELPPGSTLVANPVASGGTSSQAGNTLVLDVANFNPSSPPQMILQYGYTPPSARQLIPAPRVTITQRGRAPVTAPGALLPPEQRLVQPQCPPVDPVTGSRFFEDTGFSVADDSIWTFYHRRGGERTFGKPLSRLMLLNGAWVQLFERGLLQTLDGGVVVSVNLLEEAYLPYETFGDLTLPVVDSGLTQGAPNPGEPGFGPRSQEFVRVNAPDTFEAARTQFYTAYLDTVRYCDAYADGRGDPALLPGFSLEIWGFPTSTAGFHVVGDDVDPNTVLLRFQRGLMRHTIDAENTVGVELGYRLRAVLAGDPTAPLLEEIAGMSSLWGQYNPEATEWVDRPEELLETSLVQAFTREDTEEEAVAVAVRIWLLVLSGTTVYAADEEPLWQAEPGEWYRVRSRDGAWARVTRAEGLMTESGWILVDEAVELSR